MTPNRTATTAVSVALGVLAALAATATASTPTAARHSQTPEPGVVAGAPFAFDRPIVLAGFGMKPRTP